MTAAVTPLRLTEREWMRQVTDLAELYGWDWAHFRVAQTAKGWRTPVSGTIGEGFPDLLLTRARDRRVLFVEVKAERGKVSERQEYVIDVLREAGMVALIWRPSDWDEILGVLR